MTLARQRLGAMGEALAAAFLEARGHVVVERNYRCRRGEIDLVTRDGRTLVFCEVRTRRGGHAGPPLESVNRLKQSRVLRAARHFLLERGPRARLLRFDVVAVEVHGPAVGITHVPDAFHAD